MTAPSIQQIIAALQTGRLVDAEILARGAVQARPDDADAQLLLAISLHHQQKMDAALEVYATLAERFPENSMHVGNYATVLRDVGRVDEAEQIYRHAIELDPSNVEQLLNLGLLQIHNQRFVDARETLFKALALQPDMPAIRIHAARACMACHDKRAEELYRPWREWLPLEDPLLFELADLHLISGDAVTAASLLEDLLARSPGHLHGALLLANVYERMNRTDDAQKLLESVQAQHRGLDTGALNEIEHQQVTLAMRSGELEEARARLERIGPRHAGDYSHYFTLAKIADKLKDTQGALAALERAHAMQMDELREVVPSQFEPDAPIWPMAVDRVQPEDYARWPQLQSPDAEQSPIFIVGFPRSGTTLLEQMLDAHPALQSMDERPFFNMLADQLMTSGIDVPLDLHKLDQRDCDELRKRYLMMACGKVAREWNTQLVDKNPLSMLMLPLIHRLFPKARFILALRHPCDVLLSNYMQSFRFTSLAIACSNLTKLAEAYVEAMRVWLHHVEVFKPDVLVSRYEDLVADPQGQARRIAEFLELDDAEALMRFDQRARDKGFIATPSYAQVIEPVNRKGLNRWTRYRDAFEPALPVLAPMLEHWGYSVEGS